MNFKELQLHKNKDSCWVLLHGNVYDLTEFASLHPGGKRVILNLAGADGTQEFSKIHPKEFLLKYLKQEMNLGAIDERSVPKAANSVANDKRAFLPPLEAVLNSFDFERLAQSTLSPDAWAYYSRYDHF